MILFHHLFRVALCRLIYIYLMLVTLAAVGCHSTSTKTNDDYRTIALDPRRNSDVAQLENAKAAEFLEQGRMEEAEAALKRALAADVMHGPAHNNLGLVYYHQKKLYLAAWEFQYAIKLMPHHTEPKNNLGLIFEATGKLNEAVDWYEQARTLEPDNAQFIGNAARARIKRGDRDDRVRSLLKQIVLKDSRADWVDWARQKLALLPVEESSKPTIGTQ